VIAKDVAAKLGATGNWAKTSGGARPLETANGTHLDVLGTLRKAEERSTVEYANELLVQMQEGYRAARGAADKFKRTQERRTLEGGGRGQGLAGTLKSGDKMWLEKRPLESKLGKKYDGPYEVVEVNGDNYATIALEDGEKINVHVERLKKYKGRNVDKNAVKEINDSQADEPIKEIWVEPNRDELLPNDLIGRRVRVWWSGEHKWFDGTVTKRKKRLHVVHYDDGDVVAERLLGFQERLAPKWKLLERRGSDASFL